MVLQCPGQRKSRHTNTHLHTASHCVWPHTDPHLEPSWTIRVSEIEINQCCNPDKTSQRESHRVNVNLILRYFVESVTTIVPVLSELIYDTASFLWDLNGCSWVFSVNAQHRCEICSYLFKCSDSLPLKGRKTTQITTVLQHVKYQKDFWCLHASKPLLFPGRPASAFLSRHNVVFWANPCQTNLHRNEITCANLLLR